MSEPASMMDEEQQFGNHSPASITEQKQQPSSVNIINRYYEEGNIQSEDNDQKKQSQEMDELNVDDNQMIEKEFSKNLFDNEMGGEEDIISQSQQLMKSIKSGQYRPNEVKTSEPLTSNSMTALESGTETTKQVGFDRFSVESTKRDVPKKSKTEQKKSPDKSTKDSSQTQTFIDTIFSPFYWIIGSNQNNSKKEKQQNATGTEDKSKTQESKETAHSTSNEKSTAVTSSKKPESTSDTSSSILSTIFSSSLFSSSSNKKHDENPEPKKDEPKKESKRRTTGSPLKWIERFGADAGKAASNALKDPLERLASSPVLATGEVIVVHSLDFDNIDFRRIFKYFLFMVFTWRFSNTFFGTLLPALVGIRRRRRIEQQTGQTFVPIQHITTVPSKTKGAPSITFIPPQNYQQ